MFKLFLFFWPICRNVELSNYSYAILDSVTVGFVMNLNQIQLGILIVSIEHVMSNESIKKSLNLGQVRCMGG